VRKESDRVLILFFSRIYGISMIKQVIFLWHFFKMKKRLLKSPMVSICWWLLQKFSDSRKQTYHWCKRWLPGAFSRRILRRSIHTLNCTQRIHFHFRPKAIKCWHKILAEMKIGRVMSYFFRCPHGFRWSKCWNMSKPWEKIKKAM